METEVGDRPKRRMRSKAGRRRIVEGTCRPGEWMARVARPARGQCDSSCPLASAVPGGKAGSGLSVAGSASNPGHGRTSRIVRWEASDTT